MPATIEMTTTIDSPNWQNVIGILGGLGPHAHIEFEALLLRATAQIIERTPLDQDYPPWILSSIPCTPDRTSALVDGTTSPVSALIDSAERLKNADFGVIPCNTAHAYLEEICFSVNIPFLDMVQTTCRKAISRIGTRGTIGILATTGTLISELYPASIKQLAPNTQTVTLLDLENGEHLQQQLVMEQIFGEYGIKAGGFQDIDRKEQLAAPMRIATKKLANAGADIVLTACTEIPLVLGRKSVDNIPLLDPMEVAANDTIEIALGRRSLPSLQRTDV